MNYTCQTTKIEMTRVKMSTERSFETDFRLFLSPRHLHNIKLA